MKTRNIKIDIQTAKDWYYGEDKALKKLALQAFSIEEIKQDFRAIKTLEDACDALELKYISVKIHSERIYAYSKASAAMLKLNIIRKALNLGQDLHLAKNPKNDLIYTPNIRFAPESSTYYNRELNSDKMEVIGKIKNEGTLYNVLGGDACTSSNTGLGSFSPIYGVGFTDATFGFLGCVSKEIAQHFGKYFGMLITEAKYGDMVDFEVISSKYPN